MGLLSQIRFAVGLESASVCFQIYGKEGLHEGKINNQLYVINLENDTFLAKLSFLSATDCNDTATWSVLTLSHS